MHLGPLIAGLDIGHSKCCLACAELDPRGFPILVDVAERFFLLDDSEEQGPSSYLIEQTIKDLVSHFEKKHDVSLRTVQLAVNGPHIRGENIAHSEQSSVPSAHEVIHHLDDTGRDAPWWSGDLRHVISGPRADLQHLVKIVQKAGLKVERLVFSGLASAYAITRPVEWAQGSGRKVTVDIGAANVTYLDCDDGEIVASGVVAFGGDLVTREIASARGISRAEAERDKLAGSADPAHKGIVSRRLTETFCQLGKLGRGIPCMYLTGGGSRFPNIELLAAAVFNSPVFKGTVTGFTGNIEAIRPEHSVALGLIRYVFDKRTQQSAALRVNNGW